MDIRTTDPNTTAALSEALRRVSQPLRIVQQDGTLSLSQGDISGSFSTGAYEAYVPAIRLENLGDPTFIEDMAITYPIVAGSMANGISSCELVEAMAKAGMLGFFGAGGLPIEAVEEAVDRLTEKLHDKPFGCNLIHSPNDPALENAVVDLFLRKGVCLIEASAYLDLTLPLVRYRLHGIYRNRTTGEIITPNHVIGKISRIEVATKFMSPAPDHFLTELVHSGDITAEQAQMAREIPIAQDITAEADSGGHTDNRPSLALVPTIMALRSEIQKHYRYARPLRVGVAGGIATPAATAAAFAMGAAYVVGGTVNQACIESGTSDIVRKMLAETTQADVTMAPAADMFEMGVHVQVLKRGTMFAMRAAKLLELYRKYDSLDDIPAPARNLLEKQTFQSPLEEIWRQTEIFFQKTDPAQITRALKDPKHKMALVFRWYLGRSPRWADSGVPSRRIDYQIWCGPGMGAFNEWTKNSFLETPENRRVATVAMNLLYGAAYLTRAISIRNQGLPLDPDVLSIPPLEMENIKEYLS